jgi:hypothetical protein
VGVNSGRKLMMGQVVAGGGGLGYIESTEQQSIATNTTTLTVTLPPNRESGDVMVAVLVVVSGSGTWTTPTGWTAASDISNSAGVDIQLSVFYRITDDAEASTIDFVLSTSTRLLGSCHLYRGPSSVQECDANDLIDSTFAATDTIAEWTGTPTSLDSGDTLLSIFAISSTVDPAPDTYTEPSGTTVRDDYRVSNGSTRHGAIIIADRTAAGSDSPGVWTSASGNGTHDKAATAILILNA